MAPKRKLHLCIDCGGSKTSAVLAATGTGTILAHAIGGPSNFAYLGPKDFSVVIQETLNRALSEESVRRQLSGLEFASDSVKLDEAITLPVEESESPFFSAWIAVSGIDTPAAVESASVVLVKLLGIPVSPRLIITNDTHLLASPLATQSIFPSCITVVAGTGSCIVSFRRTNTGIKVAEVVRTGGYGWILGDEGGGFHVGRETVRELCLQEDMESINGGLLVEYNEETRPTYDLRALVMSYFGLPPTARTSDIFAELYAPDPTPSLESGQISVSATSVKAHLLLKRQQRLSRLTPLVFKAAFPPNDLADQEKFVPNPIAVKILTLCVSSLADMIILLCAPPSGTGIPKVNHVRAQESLLCLGGSLVKQQPYRELLASVLAERGYRFANSIFVETCEKGGIEALVAQAQSESSLLNGACCEG
jgi:N-acetylglucosamine kinase-like BadF-type ATPase